MKFLAHRALTPKEIELIKFFKEEFEKNEKCSPNKVENFANAVLKTKELHKKL